MTKKNDYNFNYIKEKIDQHEYVSFDVFDTLVKRNVKKPSDVFELAAIEYERKYNKHIENYKKIRIDAEIEARQKSEHWEPNIDDIYESINLDREKYNVDKLKRIEIELEYGICQKNIDFYPIYEYCIKNNKKIIITSDMYLKKKQIVHILKNADICVFDKMFISNDIKANKHNGTIYNYMIRKLNILPKQIVHIGDSKRGDYIQSKLHKIDSVLIPKNLNKLNYSNNKYLKYDSEQSYGMLQSYINNNLRGTENEYYNIGYEALGPLVFGFSKWLLKCVKEKEINRIFFLAREGNLLKNTFDIINDSSIQSEYIYVSRRSVRPFALEKAESLNDIYKAIHLKETTTVEKLLKAVGLYDEKHINMFKQIKYNKETLIKDVIEMQEIFKEIQHEISNNAKNEKKNILGYLRQKEVKGKIAICDVGWAGTMQDALQDMLEQSDMYGYYIATTHEDEKKNHFLESYNDIRPFVHLFENFFLAQHGTTLKYEKQDDEYQPVLDKYEYSIEEKKIFEDIQKGALDFVKYFNRNILNKYVNMDANISCLSMLKLGLKPEEKDINLFKDTPYVETTKMNLIEARKLSYYILHIRQFKTDFYNSGWKIGFLKSVFKIKFPYNKLYNYLLNYREKK